MTLHILVSGSRSWPETHAHVVHQALAEVLEAAGWATFGKAPPVLRHGGCRPARRPGMPELPPGVYVGVDGIADRWWRAMISGGAPLARAQVTEANWAQHGRRAGPIRNAYLVTELAYHRDQGGDAVVIGCPWGASPGTRGCLKLARDVGLRTLVHEGTALIGREAPPLAPARAQRPAQRVRGSRT